MSLTHYSRKKLVAHIVCLYALLIGVVNAASSDEHFVYSGFAGVNLTLDGAAMVTPAGLLELTNGTLRQKAHALHPAPFRFRNNGTSARSFSASFVFGILCPDADACGHGIVLFVAPGSYDLSSAFPSQYIGLVNGTTNGAAADHLFGVELDTDQNNEFRDIDGNHVGVDINGLISVDSASAGYYFNGDDKSGGFRNLTLASGEAMQVWVEYSGEAKRINVTMAALKMGRPAKPLISTTYDLSTVLADVAYVGFSSATGSFNSRHYVLGWSFAMDGPTPAIDISKLPKLPRFDPKRHAKLAEIIPPTATAAFIVSVGAIIVLAVRRRFRFRIIKGIASGLLYLHEDWEKVIIHRDVKASNVLLDSEMNGRLGDFGLARLYDHGANPHTTHVVGTIGYLAPELGRTSKATPLTDVFAFGIFILEVTCGQRPIKQDSNGDQLLLVDWVVGHWNTGSLIETVDARLHGSYDIDEVCLVLKLGLLCSHPLYSARPSMGQVVKYLDGDMALPELAPTEQSFQSLALMQSQGFDSYIMSYPSSVATMTTMCSLSGIG
ncbi:hypothetical protein PR202_gb08094 [Eleusine coracana subsp. coracana]|uniref:non-specific serine/threonine protein kinase n=1 Tax=Eleusine coracana subsp. coracana TaxID=191504 RepID=A0AAV5EDF8_ELECO|nr:hypothetical protein PR202_gb08094 [Eleusine coracana subsp. coracana]